MSSTGKKENNHLIRYANCWEDADILLEAIGSQNDKDLLFIASAGDNALAALATGARLVHAIDLNPIQLWLTELKQMGFLLLEYYELLAFLGLIPTIPGVREKQYRKIRERLSPGARMFWDDHKNLIEEGILNAGKFERYFEKFRRVFLPLVHNKEEVRKLLEPKFPALQQVFYQREWNTWKWKLLLRFFFSRFVMGRYGRDPQYLKHVNLSVPQYIRQRSEEHLGSDQAIENYFLHMIFTGSFGPHLPFYLREENFLLLKNNIHKLSLSQSSATEAVRQRTYQAYCLSNIFEYMSDKDFQGLVEEWSGILDSGALLAYWNLMVPRSFSEIRPADFELNEKSRILSARDKGFFYSRFLLEQKK